MKKIRITLILLFVLLLGINVNSYAASDTWVVETELYHNHTGNSSSGGGCYYSPVYHVHTGNSSSGGGCYTQETWINQHHVTGYNNPSQTWTCAFCGAQGSSNDYTWSCTCGRSGHYLTMSCPNGHSTGGTDTRCSESDGTRVWQLGCGKSNTTPEYYIQACNCSDGEYMGIWGLKINSLDWVTELELSAAIKEGENINTTSFSWNTGETGDTLTITENGNYECTMEYKSHTSAFEYSTLSYEVNNIDREAPTADVECDDTEWEKEKVISVLNADDSKSGLHETPYRFFDGSTWTDWGQNAEYIARENGTYQVEVRDQLENSVSYDVEITHIDYSSPTADVIYDDTNWEGKKIVIVENAADDQSGLHETPYRFYDGINWTEWGTQTEWPVYKNGIYIVEVRDAVGNVYQEEVPFRHIDEKGAIINASLDPSCWTGGDVKISVSASALCGMAEIPFSYNGGVTWTKENVISVTENGTYTVWAKDAIGRVNKKEIVVSNIDRIAPSIQSVNYIDTDENTVKISVMATDSQSGLAQYAYSYDGGSTWINFKEVELPAWDGILTIKVRDVVGNYATYNILREMKVITEEETPKSESESKIETSTKEEIILEEESESESETKEETISEPEDNPEAEIIEIDEPDMPLFDVSTLAGAGGGTILVFIFAFIWVFRTCRVLGMDQEGEYKFIARKIIWKMKDGYFIHFSKILINRSETSEFKIVLRGRFEKKNADKKLTIKHKEILYVTPDKPDIAEEIMIHAEIIEE